VETTRGDLTRGLRLTMTRLDGGGGGLTDSQLCMRGFTVHAWFFLRRALQRHVRACTWVIDRDPSIIHASHASSSHANPCTYAYSHAASDEFSKLVNILGCKTISRSPSENLTVDSTKTIKPLPGYGSRFWVRLWMDRLPPITPETKERGGRFHHQSSGGKLYLLRTHPVGNEEVSRRRRSSCNIVDKGWRWGSTRRAMSSNAAVSRLIEESRDAASPSAAG
jgi:hypothetical protein